MSEEKKDERPKVPFGRVVRFGLSMTFKTIPVLFLIINCIGILHGVSYGFTTFFTQRFFESVEALLSHNGVLRGAYTAVVALGLLMLLRELLNGVHNFMHTICFEKMRGEMNRIIHDKMKRIDPVCLEDTVLHDDINKAQEGSGTISYIVSIGVTIFTFYLPFFIFMAVYFYFLKPIFIICMALVFIPVLAGQLMRTNIIEKFEDKAAPIRRETEAHEKAVTSRVFFKETRILGGYTFFFNLLIDSIKRLGKADSKANIKTNSINLCMNIFTITGYCGIIFLLFDALLKGEISAGAFAAVYGVLGLLFGVMDEIISRHIGQIASSLGKAHNFIRFMELPERGGGDGVRITQDGVKAESVSFRYPNMQEDSVSDISLHVRAGETIAVVGENGAGKTTLARLLTGIYKPSSGKVFLHGMDTSAIAADQLFDHVSGVFQKYQKYQMTLKDNIRISDFFNEKGIETPLEQAGVDINNDTFPQGTDTMLSREFDGVDLSGGQWQRVAIARGLYRIHDTILLDEPTAAIDPLEESRIYKQFMEMSKEKTAVIITHRLGSAQIADRVIVMDKGKIAGEGTHDFLMHNCVLYRNMYSAQAEWYK